MLVSQLPPKPFQNPTGLPADQSKHLEGILPLNNSYKITHSQSHLHLPPLTLLLTLPPWHPNDRLCENKGKKRATVPVMAWKLVWPAGLCLNMSSPQHCLTSVSNRTHTCVFSDEGKKVLTLCYCVSCSSVITGRKHETSGHLVVPEWCHQVKKAGLLLRIHKEKTVLIIMHSYHASHRLCTWSSCWRVWMCCCISVSQTAAQGACSCSKCSSLSRASPLSHSWAKRWENIHIMKSQIQIHPSCSSRLYFALKLHNFPLHLLFFPFNFFY